jgi:hypothetical protein
MNAFTVALGENVFRAKSEPAPNQCTNVDGVLMGAPFSSLSVPGLTKVANSS